MDLTCFATHLGQCAVSSGTSAVTEKEKPFWIRTHRQDVASIEGVAQRVHKVPSWANIYLGKN